MEKITFEEALKHAAKAVIDKDVQEFLAMTETAPIIDVTGIELTPGDPEHCLGNGEHVDADGQPIECCCDECDYLMDCCGKFKI